MLRKNGSTLHPACAEKDGEGQAKMANGQRLFHSVAPTVSDGGEFEHRVQGAPQVRQLVCGRRWESRSHLERQRVGRRSNAAAGFSVPAGLSKK